MTNPYARSRYEMEWETPAKSMVNPRKVSCQGAGGAAVRKAIGFDDPAARLEEVAQRAVELLDVTIDEMKRIQAGVAAGTPPSFPLIGDAFGETLRGVMLMRVDDPLTWTSDAVRPDGSRRTAPTVIRWLSNLRKTIAGGHLNYTCLWSGCAGGAAYAGYGRMTVHLCAGFWAAALDVQAQMLIHEVSHIYYGTADSGGGPGSAYCLHRLVSAANSINFPWTDCAPRPAAREPEGDLFDWFPSWFPFGGDTTPKIVDRRANATKSHRKGKRDIKTVYALVLHQTAFSRGNHEHKYDNIPVHFVILPNGTILQLHDEAEYLWSSNGFNKGSVAVEFVGNFRSVRGRHYKPEEFGCHRPTPEQIQAGRDLIKYLVKKIGLTHVLAHRQSSGTRENDPGPEIWYGVGQWAVDNLKLKDGGPGFKLKGANAIPDEWRQWGSVARSHPVHASSVKQCKTLYAT